EEGLGHWSESSSSQRGVCVCVCVYVGGWVRAWHCPHKCERSYAPNPPGEGSAPTWAREVRQPGRGKCANLALSKSLGANLECTHNKTNLSKEERRASLCVRQHKRMRGCVRMFVCVCVCVCVSVCEIARAWSWGRAE